MAARRRSDGADSGPGLFDAVGAEDVPPALDPPEIPTPHERGQPSAARPTERPAPYTVGELTREIAGRLAGVGRVAVEGEVAGLKRAASGHVFFDLKEERAKLSCIVWKSQVERALRTRPAEGMQVVVHGRLDVFAPKGGYSLIVDCVEPRGLGELLARFERLKHELRAAGWFDRKRPLPALPRRVGVVTSRDGAALRDFLRTRSHRWPLYPVRLVHTSVQGVEAAAGIADGIARLDRSGVDVIVVTRGGGSLEDLWAFNERAVAEAIRGASVPVVSAVGHESDVSLADFVSDHRAHTPTDAAQTVIPDRRAYVERLERAAGYLASAVHAALERRGERVERAACSRVLKDASWILSDRRARLATARERLDRAAERSCERRAAAARELFARLERVSPRARVEHWMARTRTAGLRLDARAKRHLEQAEGRVRTLARGLEATSPLAVLGRGYSLTTRPGDAAEGGAEPVVRSADDVAPGDEVLTRLARGRIRSRVLETEREDG